MLGLLLYNKDRGEPMKKLCIAIIIIFIMFGATPVQAESTVQETYQLGKAATNYDWTQGITVDGAKKYVVDGIDIKVIEKKKSKSFFHLNKLKPVLKAYGLDSNEVIGSFQLTQMEMVGSKLYVSGLVYKDIYDKGEKWAYKLAAGETHNIVFVIEKGQAKLIHTNIAWHNPINELGDFYETDSGTSGDILAWGDGFIIAYGKYVGKPRFTFAKDGSLIFVAQREREQKSTALMADIYQYKNGKKTLLYTDDAYGEFYTIPVLNGNTLTLYYELPNTYDKYNMKDIDLKTKKVTGYPIPEDYEMERPLYINGTMYFLNNEGVFALIRNGKKMQLKWIFKAEDIKLSVFISGWDYDGKYIYITDFERRAVHTIKP